MGSPRLAMIKLSELSDMKTWTLKMRTPAFRAAAWTREAFAVLEHKTALQTATGVDNQLLILRFDRPRNVGKVIIYFFFPDTQFL